MPSEREVRRAAAMYCRYGALFEFIAGKAFEHMLPLLPEERRPAYLAQIPEEKRHGDMKQEMWQTLYPEVEIPDKNYIQGIHHTAVAGSLPDAVTAVYILERTALVNIWTLLKAMRPHGLRREMRMLAEIADDEKRHVQTGFETLKAIGAPPTSEILYIGAILDVWGRVAPALPAAIAGAAQVEIPTDMNSRLAADLVEKLR